MYQKVHLVGPLIEHIIYQDVRNHEHQISHTLAERGTATNFLQS
jgi:hypothetical protein